MAAELTVGTKIYRPASLAGREEKQRLVLDDPTMEHFDDGTVMLRAVPGPDGSFHWRVIPWDQEGGRVLVCDEPIPEDWTYFEVLFADVNFVAVSPVAGEMEELQAVYRG